MYRSIVTDRAEVKLTLTSAHAFIIDKVVINGIERNQGERAGKGKCLSRLTSREEIQDHSITSFCGSRLNRKQILCRTSAPIFILAPAPWSL